MRKETQRPNILLILTDQQRGDCLAIAGHPVLETPNLDFLGRSGAHFRRAYSECPHCMPARRSLITGQAPAAHGLLRNEGKGDWSPAHTLPGELRGAGYQTELVGKLHVGPARKRYGFDHLTLADSTRGANDYVEWLATQSGAHVEGPIDRWAMAHGVTPNGWIGRPTHLHETQTLAFWCATEAIKVLAKRDPSAPFFLNVSFLDPHPPCAPPPFCFERYDPLDLPPPIVGEWAPDVLGPGRGDDPEAVKTDGLVHLTERQMRHWRAAYYGSITHVDYQIGRLLQFMRERDLLDDTLVVFASDHGEMLGDHHMIGKMRAFEGSAHVPFLVHTPRSWGLRAGRTIDAPVGLQDVMPTLLEAANLPIPETVTGRSVLPLLRGEERALREALHGECAGRYADYGPMHYLTDGRSKYVWYSQTGQEQLFDLESDPHERRNLAAQGGGPLEEWRERLVDVLRERPEGFVEGRRLVAGRKHAAHVPALSA